ncbi:MAG: hypothetical protein PHD65_06270 [Gallionella sp.]|nr:hypothetical protein [Gallionella sp.]
MAIDKIGQNGRLNVQLLIVLRTLVVVEINNLCLVFLRMGRVNLIGVKNYLLMGVRLNIMLVLSTAMIVLHIQMRVQWRPTEYQKSGAQKEKQCFVETLLDHVGVEPNVFCMPETRPIIYTSMTKLCFLSVNGSALENSVSQP